MTLTPEQRRLGWRTETVQEFLGLTDEEMEEVARRRALLRGSYEEDEDGWRIVAHDDASPRVCLLADGVAEEVCERWSELMEYLRRGTARPVPKSDLRVSWLRVRRFARCVLLDSDNCLRSVMQRDADGWVEADFVEARMRGHTVFLAASGREFAFRYDYAARTFELLDAALADEREPVELVVHDLREWVFGTGLTRPDAERLRARLHRLIAGRQRRWAAVRERVIRDHRELIQALAER